QARSAGRRRSIFIAKDYRVHQSLDSRLWAPGSDYRLPTTDYLNAMVQGAPIFSVSPAGTSAPVVPFTRKRTTVSLVWLAAYSSVPEGPKDTTPKYLGVAPCVGSHVTDESVPFAALIAKIAMVLLPRFEA